MADTQDSGPGILASLGEGLRGAGAVLAPQVYQQQNAELMQRQAEQFRKLNMLGQVILQGINSGSIPQDQGRIALQRLGFGPASNVVAPSQEAQANQRFLATLGGGAPGTQPPPGAPAPSAPGMGMPSMGAPVGAAPGGIDPSLLASPMYRDMLKVGGQQANLASQIQDRKDRAADRAMNLASLISDREARADDRKTAQADRERYQQESLELRRQAEATSAELRRLGMGLQADRLDAARQTKEQKAAVAEEKSVAPVNDLVENIDQAINMIRTNPGVTGAHGMYSRGKELVSTTVSGDTNTPANDFQSQLLQIQTKWRQLPNVARSRLKIDASNVDNTIKGLGVMTNDAIAINSLTQLRDNLTKGVQAREGKTAEAPQPAAPKKGETSTSKSGKPIHFDGQQWVYD